MPDLPTGAFAITSLTCEYLVNPQGLDETCPRLGWNMESAQRDKQQVAYRILAASSPGKLEPERADLWDTGFVEDNRSSQIPYAGKPLRSRQPVFWKVMVRDEGEATVTSDVASWTMGLLEEDDWQAGWIALHPDAVLRDPDARASDPVTCASPGYFRKPFTLSGRIRRATLYASARGLIKLSMNGHAVTPDQFVPEWTDYNRRIHYRSFEVANLLLEGENVIGAVLGDGWFSGYVGWQEERGQYGLRNSFCAQLEVEYEDGSNVTIGTDETWQCNTGPILFSDFMMGESFDARRRDPLWNARECDPGRWIPAEAVDAPRVPLVAQRSQAVRVTQTLRPVSIRQSGPDTWLCDLGQNIAGWLRIRVNEKAGTRIRLCHGERLTGEGRLFTENLRRARATDEYICAGNGPEEWEPSFTFHGFQYFTISGLSKAPTADELTGCVVQSATPQTGKFRCSHAGVNRLWLNGLWSQIDNFLSVPTDCPQRDERLGWMGDAQVFIRTAAFNMDVAAFFTKWMVDVEDAQTGDGIFPDTAPRLPEGPKFAGLDGLGGGAGWADAGVIIPWTIWKVYGDEKIITRHWPAMSAWLAYLERTNPDGLRTRELGNNYGDWLCIPSDTSFRTQSPMKNLLATAFWADDAAKMAEMARALGLEGEARRFSSLFGRVRRAFQKEFVNPDGSLTIDTQTAYLLVLAMDLVPRELRPKTAARLVENIRSLDTHLSTGFIGIRHLNPILTEAGYADVAYELLLKDDYPSWLYPVRHGATTIWERWNAWTEEQGFLDAHMNSFNHYSFGSIGEWLYRHVAGIDYIPEKPGFRHFRLCPYPHPSLEWAEAEYRSIHGRIASRWEFTGGNRLQWKVTIPANTRARLHFPTTDAASLLEAGHPLAEKMDPPTTFDREHRPVIDLSSGTYRFACLFNLQNGGSPES